MTATGDLDSRKTMKLRLLLAVLLLTACEPKPITVPSSDDSGTEDSGDAGDDRPEQTRGNGQLGLRFAINPDLVEPISDTGETTVSGTFIGIIYDAAQVTATGPQDDAMELEQLNIPMDLLIDGGPGPVLHTSGMLNPVEVSVLGFIDLNGNLDPDNMEPDGEDAVTLPHVNAFDVVTGQIMEVTVEFGMLYPGRK